MYVCVNFIIMLGLFFTDMVAIKYAHIRIRTNLLRIPITFRMCHIHMQMLNFCLYANMCNN